ncbi:TonB-dependent receptor [Paraflavisolibacter sp. H34]|uniref:SusC/RagA family TonB-linked outer membrane protein n=1 Tax=Huijunlia imazamoxiresistens TaxID=3127457 RepID=UPI00301AF575
MLRKLCLSLLLTGAATLTWAQTHKITGTVTRSGASESLSGVSVTVKGTNTTVTTDANGKFTINAPLQPGTVLVFSHVGFSAQEVKVGEKTSFSIALKDEAATMSDVVVIGYGKAKKSDLTGAVGIVSGKDLAKTPVVNAAEALTGKVAGLQVTTTEGSPDAEIKVRLRGGGSVTGDNSPLYIVDGFPVSTISNIAASDIETITFLKDAASTAIYGARAANGVFLVTTKEGKAGKISVTANAYGGFRKITKELDVLNPYEYALYQYEIDQSATFQNYYGAYKDLEIYKSMKGTDWQKEVFGRAAKQQYYNVGVSGGTKATRFNLNLTRNEEESIMLGSGYERNNLNFKINSDISSKLSFDFNTRLSHMKIDGAGVNTGSGSNTRLRNSIKYAPTRGLKSFDQSLIDDDNSTISAESQSLLYDPVKSVLDEYKKQSRLNNTFNGGLSWKVAKGITWRTEGGYEFRNERTDNVWGPYTSNAQQYAGQPIGQISSLNGYNYRVSNFLTVDKSNFINGHSLTVVAGQEALSSGFKRVTNESRFFPRDMKADDVMAFMNLGTAIPTVTTISPDTRMSSYFGRANYSLFNKYLLTATMRADGSSIFAQGKQWGYFPSVALGWKISDEEWMKSQSGWLNQLKLRTSYGTTGNNRIDPNLWALMYSTSSENKPYFTNEVEAAQLIPGSNLPNPDLKWETTVVRNAGLDFSLFRSRLSGTLDVYWNTTNDLLVQAPIPTQSGFTSQFQNFGSTSNKGIELVLDGSILNTKDYSLNASFNIGMNRNRVEEFRNGVADFKTYTSGWNGTAQPLEDYIIRQGQPVGQMYGYVTDGMYSFDDFTFNNATKKWDLNKGVADNSSLTSATYFGPGALKFKDISGPNGEADGVIDAYDKTVIGNANPVHTGGFSLNGRYKAFDMMANFNWTYGNDIYNANKIDYTTFLLSRKYQNLLADMSLENRFTIIDPETGYNVASGANANPERLKAINANASIWSPLMTQTPLHSWAIEDGSFLRLNTVTLGYTLPQSLTKRARISTLRVYVTGYNLYTLTNYSGFDPEVDSRRNPPVTPGVDYSAYPKSRSFIGGVNVTF